MIDKLKNELKPKYQNDVYTWFQIKKAVRKVLLSEAKLFRIWLWAIAVCMIAAVIFTILWMEYGYSYWGFLIAMALGTIINFTMWILVQKAFWKNF